MEDREIHISDDSNTDDGDVTNNRPCQINFISRIQSCFTYLRGCIFNESDSNQDDHIHDHHITDTVGFTL